MPAAGEKEGNGLLPKGERITSGREIKNTRQFRFTSPLLHISAAYNDRDRSRLAVVCPARLGTAVVRNRTKRQLAQAFKEIQHKIAKNMDLVVFPKQVGVKTEAYTKSIIELLGDLISD